MDNKTETVLSDDQIRLLKAWAIIMKDDNAGATYYHLPQVFKDLGNGEFEVINYQELPDSLKEYYIGEEAKRYLEYHINH